MPVSLPEGEVGVSASFRMISFAFEAIRGEYLSRTQPQRKGRPSCPFCTRHKLVPWPKTGDIYIYIYIYTDALAVLLVHVELAQARPNYKDSALILYKYSGVVITPSSCCKNGYPPFKPGTTLGQSGFLLCKAQSVQLYLT